MHDVLCVFLFFLGGEGGWGVGGGGWGVGGGGGYQSVAM